MNTGSDIVLITGEALSLDAAVRALGHGGGSADPEAGALVTFSGNVRAGEGDRQITHLSYEQYEGMAEQEIRRLIDAARNSWPLRRVGVWHRIGDVAVGEPSVIIAVSASHRAEAFDACRFLIDRLKESVPIWKKAPL